MEELKGKKGKKLGDMNEAGLPKNLAPQEVSIVNKDKPQEFKKQGETEGIYPFHK